MKTTTKTAADGFCACPTLRRVVSGVPVYGKRNNTVSEAIKNPGTDVFRLEHYSGLSRKELTDPANANPCLGCRKIRKK